MIAGYSAVRCSQFASPGFGRSRQCTFSWPGSFTTALPSSVAVQCLRIERYTLNAGCRLHLGDGYKCKGKKKMARDVTSAREKRGETEAWEARSVLFSSDGLVAAVALDAVQRALAQGEPVDAPAMITHMR